MQTRRTNSRKGVAAIGSEGAPVVVIGDVMVDIIIKPQRAIRVASDTDSHIRLGLGGAGANTAIHLRRLGVPTMLMGRIGADELGWLALSTLQQHRLATAVEPIAHEPTGAIGILVDHQGQRTMFPQRGSNKLLDTHHIARHWPRTVRGLFVSGYALFEETTREAARLAMERARQAGVPIAVDPASYAMIEDVGANRFLRWCEGATVILPNRQEAQVLAYGSVSATPPEAGGAGRGEQLLIRLARTFPTVVIKLDRDGAMGRNDSETAHVPAHDVNVIDTTGAGDAFNAGFLAAHLAGKPLRNAISAGNTLAAEVVQGLGTW